MKIYLTIIGLAIAIAGTSQSIKFKAPKTGEVIVVNEDGGIIKTMVYIQKKKLEPKPERYYYWYKSDQVLITQGGFDGRLLHGKMSEFYDNNNLKSQGKFRFGVKKGRWTEWYSNGNIRRMDIWIAGVRQGKFSDRNEDGSLLRKGTYLKGNIHGIVKEYKDGVVRKYRYKNGVLSKEIVPKEKQVKEKEKADESNKTSLWSRLKKIFSFKKKDKKERPVKEKSVKEKNRPTKKTGNIG